MIAGGAYMPPAPWLAAIREKIDDEPGKLRSIISSKEFIKYFKQIEGERLKKAPKGYPSDHPELDLLKHKSFLAVNEVTDKFVMSPDFHTHILSAARAMKPFNDFLNEY
jgi:uncharacterized protein (TIGR02453 family)